MNEYCRYGTWNLTSYHKLHPSRPLHLQYSTPWQWDLICHVTLAKYFLSWKNNWKFNLCCGVEISFEIINFWACFYVTAIAKPSCAMKISMFYKINRGSIILPVPYLSPLSILTSTTFLSVTFFLFYFILLYNTCPVAFIFT